MILDANALSAFLDGDVHAVAAVAEASELAIPVIVAGEFAFGIAQSRYREEYEQSLKRLLEHCTVLNIEIAAARQYAAIRLGLKQSGKPIPANDAWIAALSLQHSMPVMSRDKHFDAVNGLTRQNW